MSNTFTLTAATGSANVYCTVTQFFQRYDRRLFAQLTNENASRTSDNTVVQSLLDECGSELDSYLQNRYPIPCVKTDGSAPTILTRWVAAKTADRLFARRSDAPRRVVADIEWAEKWIDRLINREISIPDIGVSASATPQLTSSANLEGKSRFDGILFLDKAPSDTSTSKGE